MNCTKGKKKKIKYEGTCTRNIIILQGFSIKLWGNLTRSKNLISCIVAKFYYVICLIEIVCDLFCLVSFSYL